MEFTYNIGEFGFAWGCKHWNTILPIVSLLLGALNQGVENFEDWLRLWIWMDPSRKENWDSLPIQFQTNKLCKATLSQYIETRWIEWLEVSTKQFIERERECVWKCSKDSVSLSLLPWILLKSMSTCEHSPGELSKFQSIFHPKHCWLENPQHQWSLIKGYCDIFCKESWWKFQWIMVGLPENIHEIF